MSDFPVAAKAIPKAILGHLRRAHTYLRLAASLANLRSRLRDWAQPVTYLGLGALATIYCTTAYLVTNDRNAATETAIRQGENLVRVIEQSYSHIFQNVDSSLIFLRNAYQQNPSTFDISDWVQDSSIRNYLAFDFTIADADGRIIKATKPFSPRSNSNIIGMNIGDRPYFRDQSAAVADALLISPPLTLKSSGTVAIILARRMTAPDGTFAGVVSALLDPTELGRIASGIDFGPDGTFGLIGLDGIFRARIAGGRIDPHALGRKIAPETGVLRHAAKSRTGLFWSTPGLIDDVSRLVSFRALGSHPMIATVTMTESQIYRHANEKTRTYATIAVILTIAILMAIAYGATRQRKLNDAIAEMKRAQSAMRQSQERYRLVEDAVNDGIWDWNILTGEDYLSPRWKSILGFADDELPDTTASFFDRIHPDDKAAVTEAVRAHLEENKSYDLDMRLRHKNGDYRWINSRGKALRDAAGRPVRMVGTITDIGERKQSEALIEESRDNLARAEAMTHMGHYKYDLVTGTYTWSDGLYRIMGKSRDTFTPTLESTAALVHPDDRPVLERYRRDVMAGRDVSTVTIRGIKDDGGIVLVELWSAPTRARDGAITGMFGASRDVTARVSAETAVKESHDNLARAEEIALLGHTRLDLATGAYTWSAGVYRIMRKSPDTFTPKLDDALALIHPDDRAAHLQYRHDVTAGIEVPRKTLRAVLDGETIHIEFWSVPIRDKNGVVTGKFSTLQDVTAKKQAEAQAEESHNNLARAESMVRLGHYKYDKKSDTMLWSDGTYRIFGKSPGAFTPARENVFEIFHPEDRASVNWHRTEALAGREHPRFTARIVKDDGQIACLQCWSTPIRAGDGTVTGYFGTVQDVTERNQAEALIKESLANLERAERLALLGHYKIDRNTGNLTWSEGIFRIFGLSSAHFTPTLRGALELIHPDDRHLLRQFRDQAMAGKEIPHATLRGLRTDDQVIDIEYWSTPVRNCDGAITGIFGTVQDVSLRKRAENALALANQELEARVGERTAELAAEMKRREEAQMTLGQMQKMDAVGQLTAGIAHDFNNLLAVISGSLEFVDSAATRGLTAEPELIDAALRATRRGTELVRRLLAFSRQSPLRAEPTPINQLVLDTLRLLQRTLGQGIDMVTQLDAEAAVISVDRNQMANALLNLALNARDAMPDGGQLTIATRCQALPAKPASGSPRSPSGEVVCITISDTGAGMTEEVRKRAVEPFFTTKPDGLGSGLGLSMVQGFVEQSGGQIDIDSEPGRGTTITIRLPRVAATGPTEDAGHTDSLPRGGRDKTVLLVEDDPDVRVVTAAQLKSLGYKVHAVANGMEAIDLIASPANIDITLTDIVLPGGFDGVELIKEAMRARPNMGVLCMSGYDPTRKHRKWLQVQNINFLQKPFSSSRLAQALDAALAH